METKTIDIKVQPGIKYTINLIPKEMGRKRQPGDPKPMHSEKDEEGSYTLIGTAGKMGTRISTNVYMDIFKGTQVRFSKEASVVLGGASGVFTRLYMAIQNIKFARTKGKTLYGVGLHGLPPSLNDFDIWEDSEGRVMVATKL